MTYGVDQCRVCGKAIPPTDSNARERYEKSQRGEPTMSEAEWRAAGFKAMPTKRQIAHPREGTCFECQLPMGLRTVSFSRLFYPVLAAVLAAMLFAFGVASIFT